MFCLVARNNSAELHPILIVYSRLPSDVRAVLSAGERSRNHCGYSYPWNVRREYPLEATAVCRDCSLTRRLWKFTKKIKHKKEIIWKLILNTPRVLCWFEYGVNAIIRRKLTRRWQVFTILINIAYKTSWQILRRFSSIEWIDSLFCVCVKFSSIGINCWSLFVCLTLRRHCMIVVCGSI